MYEQYEYNPTVRLFNSLTMEIFVRFDQKKYQSFQKILSSLIFLLKIKIKDFLIKDC